MRQYVAVFLIAIFVGTAIAQEPSWSYCKGSDGSKLTITSTPVQPFPIKKGSPMKFTANGTAKGNFNVKNGKMDVFTGDSKIFSTAVGSTATGTAGESFTWTFGYTIPSFVPPGSYVIGISLVDTSGSTVTCIQFSQNF